MKPLLVALLALGGGGLLLGSKRAGADENESGAPPLPPLPPTGGGGSGSTSTPPFVPPPPGSSGSGSSSSGSTTDPPDSVLAAVTTALASANPATMRATAAQLRKQGWTLQAAGLEEAARLTELAQQTGQTPPPVASPPASPPVVPGAGSVPLPPGATPPAKPPVLTVPPKVRLLRSGLSGADVAAWQTVLKADGYDLGATGVDGKFGPKTVAATKAWQSARNVKADGIVGPATLAKIGTQSNAPPVPAKGPKVIPSSWRTLKQGAAGNDVKAWQQVLIADGYSVGSTGADGKFGPNTTKATKAWQSARGLTPDGIVGAGSRAKINPSYIQSTGLISTMSGDVQPLELMSSTPLPGIVPHMDPLPDVNPARALAARTCVMLFNTRPGAEDRELVEQFQALTGAKETGLYTAGTALKFVQFGLVPPKPFYWSKKGASRSKRQYRDILLAKAAQDPARHDEWAAAALVR